MSYHDSIHSSFCFNSSEKNNIQLLKILLQQLFIITLRKSSLTWSNSGGKTGCYSNFSISILGQGSQRRGATTFPSLFPFSYPSILLLPRLPALLLSPLLPLFLSPVPSSLPVPSFPPASLLSSWGVWGSAVNSPSWSGQNPAARRF